MSTALTAVADYDMGAANDRIDDIDAIVWKAARVTAQMAFARYCRNLHVKLYLYHKPSRHGFAGHTCVATDMPGHGWQLSTPEHLPRHYAGDKLTYWVHAILRRLPILGY